MILVTSELDECVPFVFPGLRNGSAVFVERNYAPFVRSFGALMPSSHARSVRVKSALSSRQ
jgi:hypothetical protein